MTETVRAFIAGIIMITVVALFLSSPRTRGVIDSTAGGMARLLRTAATAGRR